MVGGDLTDRGPTAGAQLAAKGVVVRAADFDDEDTLVKAFSGAKRLLLIRVIWKNQKNDCLLCGPQRGNLNARLISWLRFERSLNMI